MDDWFRREAPFGVKKIVYMYRSEHCHVMNLSTFKHIVKFVQFLNVFTKGVSVCWCSVCEKKNSRSSTHGFRRVVVRFFSFPTVRALLIAAANVTRHKGWGKERRRPGQVCGTARGLFRQAASVRGAMA